MCDLMSVLDEAPPVRSGGRCAVPDCVLWISIVVGRSTNLHLQSVILRKVAGAKWQSLGALAARFSLTKVEREHLFSFADCRTSICELITATCDQQAYYQVRYHTPLSHSQDDIICD
jgi:hypothetical protein